MVNFIIGMFAGALLLTIILATVPAGKLHDYDVAIEQCEKELPRNKTCEIFAKPALINNL